MKNIKFLTLALIFGFITTNVMAQTDEPVTDKKNKANLSVGAGFAYIPEYEGANDYMAVPFPLFSLDWNSGQYVRLVGLDIEANILGKKHKNWEFGPKLSFKPGRDNDIENINVANLEEIDFSISAGLFAQYKFAKGFDVRGEYTHDISGVSEGGVADFELGHTWIKKNNRLITRVAATTSLATENYMDTYFGVNPDNLGTSLLPFYDLDGGIKDVGLKLTTTYFLNQKWILAGQVGLVELLGDAADSPIVTTGTSTQFVGGVSVMYRF